MITVTVSCDICTAPAYHDGEEEWAAIRQALYNAGWRRVKEGWENVCPQCMFEARREADADRIHFLARKREEHYRRSA